MADTTNQSHLVPQPGGGLTIKFKEYDALGKATEIEVPMPTVGNFREWTLMQQVAMLKKGSWNKQPINEIMYAIAYANSLGADIMQGEVYPVGDGRIATSDKFKIKKALSTDRIVGMRVSFKELDEEAPDGCVLENDLECTIEIDIRGWVAPIIRKGKLSRWFKTKNPNWKENPEHMLEMRVKAKACEDVVPFETGEDEAPPVDTPYEEGRVLRELKAEMPALDSSDVEEAAV